MLRIDVIAAGKMREPALRALWDEYKTRLGWSLTLYEIDVRNRKDELKRLEEKLDPRAYLFALDEKGKSLPSIDFARRLEGLAADGRAHVQFLIGGADGLSPELRKKADFLLSFGSQTWPHMLVRVMLIEQIYRARLIIAGHPYHRE